MNALQKVIGSLKGVTSWFSVSGNLAVQDLRAGLQNVEDRLAALEKAVKDAGARK